MCAYLAFSFSNPLADFFRLDEPLARLYTAQIALALAHLHEIGILYRDLKPENVLICGRTGNTMITDMGLAAPIVVVEDDDQKAADPDLSQNLTTKFETEGITLQHVGHGTSHREIGNISHGTPQKDTKEVRMCKRASTKPNNYHF